jgi:hypothetical protein
MTYLHVSLVPTRNILCLYLEYLSAQIRVIRGDHNRNVTGTW